MNIYKEKYEKYKKKYLDLKKLLGGLPPKEQKASKVNPIIKQNIEIFNEKFKSEYENKSLSLLGIIVRCFNHLEDNNFHLWDKVVKDIFIIVKRKFDFLTDINVIDLLNFRFKKITESLFKKESLKIDDLFIEINKINEELTNFLVRNTVSDLFLLLSYEKNKSFDTLSFENAIEKVKEELTPMTSERIQEFMYKKIHEPQEVPIRNHPLVSSLRFDLPEAIFPESMKQRYNFLSSVIDDRTVTASCIQLALFSLTDRQVYIIIRNLILKFGQDIDLLQNDDDRGEDYCHFNRPFSNLIIIAQTERELYQKINYPICIEIFQVGKIFEFLERIKFLVQKKEKLIFVARTKTPAQNEHSARNHIRQIINLYINIDRLNLWNLVIQLYNIQKRLYYNQTAIYDDISLIISFILYYFKTNTGGNKDRIINSCIDILFNGIKYR
jgi:hypothetical protein